MGGQLPQRGQLPLATKDRGTPCQLTSTTPCKEAQESQPPSTWGPPTTTETVPQE